MKAVGFLTIILVVMLLGLAAIETFLTTQKGYISEVTELQAQLNENRVELSKAEDELKTLRSDISQGSEFYRGSFTTCVNVFLAGGELVERSISMCNEYVVLGYESKLHSGKTPGYVAPSTYPILETY